MAKVGTSAIESRKLGYLLWSDVIVPNKDELLYVATQQAKAMFDSGYRRAGQSVFPVAGRSAIATIKGQLANMRDGGFISAHDFHISALIADVVCGGEVEAGSLVSEEYLMALERKHFCALLGEPEDPRANHGHAADRQAGAELTHPSAFGAPHRGAAVEQAGSAAAPGQRFVMSKQIQDAYIVAATRTPIGKSGRGYFKNTRPDDLLVAAVQGALKQVPTLDPKADRGRHHRLLVPGRGAGHEHGARRDVAGRGLPNTVGGVTVNRFLRLGPDRAADGGDRIRVGEADVMIAGGAESMSMVPDDGRQQAVVQPGDLRQRTRTSASPTAWA